MRNSRGPRTDPCGTIIRILFGDLEAYKDKFRTCARTRTLDKQILDSSFYMKEHTKPLFEKHGILTVHNLYSYHTFMEIFRILKTQTPICLHSQYKKSARKYLTYINLNPPKPSAHFIYKIDHLDSKIAANYIKVTQKFTYTARKLILG